MKIKAGAWTRLTGQQKMLLLAFAQRSAKAEFVRRWGK
ncbi:hypothetical protein PEPMIC_00044 [Parvimonas micra ATCC 33270]|uniref:Uncharacterized protein n=1 Tax=Parvimonas micra ATCC 33270 TaxID=411465 RepID=A8SI92_9FIRM|nr:hypothetical protein PEPMIC_00044 [Parvimonas micra ATCC 33270]